MVIGSYFLLRFMSIILFVGGYVIDITRMTKNISSDFFTGIEKKERLPLYYFNTDSKKKRTNIYCAPIRY